MEQSKKARSGPLAAVPCPWCRKKNNHTEVPADAGRETFKKTGITIQCDHCDESYIIMRAQLVVTVVQYHQDETPCPKEKTENG